MAKRKKISTRKIKKFILLLVLISLIIFGLIMGGKKLLSKRKIHEVKVVDKLADYGYELVENKGNYYESLFKELKAELNQTEVDYDRYATIISQLFITDFFTLENKTSKNDIGGTQFVYKNFQTDFEKLAKAGIYHSVKSNIYGDRKQELPVVSKVEVTNLSKREYDYLDQTDENAYTIDVTITYEKELGYQKEATLVLVHVENRLELVKMS